MKLRMLVRGVVDREMREVGETLTVTDPGQVTAMLESRTAIPADPGELAVYRSNLPAATSWVSNWRR